MRKTGLFRIFSELDASRVEETALEFASEHGHLGLAGSGIDESGLSVLAEPVLTWEKEIRRMRDSVRIWDLAKARNRRALKADLVVDERSIIGPRLSFPRSLRSADIVEHALDWVLCVANQQLGQHTVQPMIRWSLDDRGEELIDRGGNPVFRIRPTSLIGALWLQFALAIVGDKEYRRCAECEEPFEVSREGARTNRRFCSDACKMRAYRRRKAGVETGVEFLRKPGNSRGKSKK